MFKEKILITGSTSNIAKELIKILPLKKNLYLANSKNLNMKNIDNLRKKKNFFKKFDKLIFLHSVISPKKLQYKTQKEINDQININLVSIIEISEIALKYNKKAKILIMGSESGLKGSFDIIYGLTKSGLHKYAEERKIQFKDQQLICLAPSTIIDGGITIKRKDKRNIKKSINLNPKKRGLKSKEVAKIIHYLLFKGMDYITNTVIHVNGGKFSRM